MDKLSIEYLKSNSTPWENPSSPGCPLFSPHFLSAEFSEVLTGIDAIAGKLRVRLLQAIEFAEQFVAGHFSARDTGLFLDFVVALTPLRLVAAFREPSDEPAKARG
jgi:hypothetical protein